MLDPAEQNRREDSCRLLAGSGTSARCAARRLIFLVLSVNGSASALSRHMSGLSLMRGLSLRNEANGPHAPVKQSPGRWSARTAEQRSGVVSRKRGSGSRQACTSGHVSGWRTGAQSSLGATECRATSGNRCVCRLRAGLLQSGFGACWLVSLTYSGRMITIFLCSCTSLKKTLCVSIFS